MEPKEQRQKQRRLRRYRRLRRKLKRQKSGQRILTAFFQLLKSCFEFLISSIPLVTIFSITKFLTGKKLLLAFLLVAGLFFSFLFGLNQGDQAYPHAKIQLLQKMILEKNSKIRTMETKIESLLDSNNKLILEKSEVEKDLANTKGHLSELQTSHKQLMKEGDKMFETLAKKVGANLAECQKLNKNQPKISDQLMIKLKSEYDPTIKELTTLCRDFENFKINQPDQFTSLADDFKSLIETNTSEILGEWKAEKDSVIQNLQKKLEDSETALKEANTTILNLQQENEKYKNILNDLKDIRASLDKISQNNKLNWMLRWVDVILSKKL